MPRRWTTEELDFLRANYLTMSLPDIAGALGRTPSQCKAAASNHGINGKRRVFTADEIDLVKRLYADTDTADLARQIGRTVLSLYGLATKLGLYKSEAYQAEKRRKEAERLKVAGVGNRFKKGQAPANKGLRRPGWHRGRMKETQFKKGQRPSTWKPIGSERICSKDGYILVKVTEGQPLNYKHKHRIVWEEHNGPIPEGMRIAFKDGNKLNCSIKNLELVTAAELMSRNTVHNYPPEVKAQIQTLAGFKRKLNRYAKKQDRRSA